MRSVLSTALVLALAGCTTTCRFDTNAPGAKLYLDGVPVGVMPCDVELDDGKTAYTIRAEHSDFQTVTAMIRQTYAGTVTNQQQQTTVNAQTNAYGAGNSVNTNTFGTVNQNTQTYNTPVYAWTTRYLISLPPRQAGTTPPAAPQTTTTPAPATGQRGAFCSGCGRQFTGDAPFCSGCGARR